VGLTNVTAVAGGFGHSVALRSDGTVVSWGDVGSAGLSGVTAIAAAHSRTVVLIGNGLTTPHLRYTSTTPAMVSTNGFMLQLTLEAGRSFRLQSTTNFVNWTDITNITGTGLPYIFTDRSATNRPYNFYRTITP
jgi:alpha-tubulin suppressor-like RCC1 family protein